jgi:Ca2+-binding RTX toxin-like protein
MPSIIPSPGSPGVEPNLTNAMPISSDVYVAAGSTIYTTTAQYIYRDGSGSIHDFVNDGALWNRPATRAGGQGVINSYYLDHLVNRGLMVAEALDGDVITLNESLAQGGIVNSGQIFALAGDYATAIIDGTRSGGSYVFTIENSGLIAARGGLGAIAIDRYFQGGLVNTATGSILAEGGEAIAVRMKTPFTSDLVPMSIENAGRIEASSTNIATASIAIHLFPRATDTPTIVNSGIIRGDYAMLVVDSIDRPPRQSSETLINEAAGLIDGIVSLGRGDDVILNNGRIGGSVILSEGNDRFDNSAGLLVGVGDLGWGDDSFVGGSGTDAVMGERGDDRLAGGGGNDLLLGGRGNDEIDGGIGFDALYGEAGDDVLRVNAGDRAFGGLGNDRIELADYRFAAVDGGAGFDTLVLPEGPRLLDLRAALYGGRITGFEKIALSAGHELVVRTTDLAGIGSDGELVVDGNSSSKVDLLGGWVETGTRSIDGISYRIFGADGVRVLVQLGANVATVATVPADAIGLDEQAWGDAPLVGTIPGATLSASDYQVSRLALTSSLTIDADESWRSANGAPVLTYGNLNDGSLSLVNRGLVESIGGADGARAIETLTISLVENSGTIRASGVGTAQYLDYRIGQFENFAIWPGSLAADQTVALSPNASRVLNSGTISAQSEYSVAIATGGSNLENSGTITATSDRFFAVGATMSPGLLVNTGTISAHGGHAAYGVHAVASEATLIVNHGLIEATRGPSGATTVGIFFFRGFSDPAPGFAELVNSGTIRAEIAVQSQTASGNGVWIRNSGDILGRIELDSRTGGSTGIDVVENGGLIVGAVNLGAGNDIYIGTNGRQQGDVQGGAGVDQLVGTAFADRLLGDDGSDLLVGGLGADLLTGGLKGDTFLYRAAAESTTDATDTITDFQTGVDRIDLTALAVTSLTLTAAAGYFLVQAATASGTLTVRVEGSIQASDVIVANIPTMTGTSGADLLVATVGGSSLSGGLDADMLFGQAGNDRLDGGRGVDIMWGGAGDDYYVVDDVRDIVVELANGGIDTIEYSGGPRYVLPDNVENGVAQGGGALAGNALDNVITGDRNMNFLDGGAGADLMIGGEGPDAYTVDNVGDRIVETGLDYDHVISSIDYVLAADLENLTLTGSATIGAGNARQNQMYGAELNDTLSAGDNDDWLDGMAGDDRLYGEDGADKIFGRADSDRLFGGAGDDEIQGGDHGDWIEGGDGDDLIYADDPPMLTNPGPLASIGTDVIIGGAGADNIRLGFGADRVIYLAATESTAAARDTIGAFQTGEDKIDLSALGPLSLSWTEENDGGVIFRIVTATGAAGTLSLRVAGNITRSDFMYQDVGMTLTGSAGNDDVEGWNGTDLLSFQQGGDDRVRGHEGNDGFYFGAALTGLDIVDGGTGTDTLAIQGNYASLVLGGVSNVEVLFVAPGSDTRFGDTAGNFYDYAISGADSNVAAGATLTVQASELRAGEDLSFNGAAESDGRFRMFAGRGVDSLVGGANSDGFFFGADGNLTGADRIDGGAGTDSIALRGNYTGARAIVFQDASFANVEVLTLLSGHTNEFGGFIDTNGFDYDVTLANGNVGAGQRLDVIATNLRANESAHVDARAELDGTVRILSGTGDDILFGGGGNDILYGGLGADTLDGGAGSDLYQYRAVGESNGAARDTLAFASGDKIDLSLIDANGATGANDTFAFIGDAAFSNVAGQLRAYQSGADWIVEGDLNGDGVGDLMIAVTSASPLIATDFIL